MSLLIFGLAVAFIFPNAFTFMVFFPTLPKSSERPVEGILPLRLLKELRVGTATLLEIVAVPLGAFALSQVGIYAQELRFAAAIATAAVIMVALGNILGRFIAGGGADNVSVTVVQMRKA